MKRFVCVVLAACLWAITVRAQQPVAGTAEMPVLVRFEQLDPGRLLVDGDAFKSRLKLQNLLPGKRRLNVSVHTITAGSIASPRTEVVRSELMQVELAEGESRTWAFDYTLGAGIYSGRVAVCDAETGSLLGESGIQYCIFPREQSGGSRNFCVYSSGLSPFVVVRNDGPRTLLFQGLEPYGLGGPSHVAFQNDHKPTVFSTASPIDPANMTESWMLFWFNGAKGWDRVENTPYPIDVPIFVVLQKKPTAIKPAGGGVELTFEGESGHIAIVPFHGVSLVRATETSAWHAALPDQVFQRCRMLAEISREYPIKVDEQFKINPRLDKVLIRDRFEFLSIDDEWATPHRKIAPLEFMTALAHRSGFRLLSVSGKVVDLDMPVGAGAFAGVEGEECSYTLTGFLRYINTVEQPKAVPANDPLLADARRNFDWNRATPAGGDSGASTALGQAAAVATYLRYADPTAQDALRLSIQQAADRALDPRNLALEYAPATHRLSLADSQSHDRLGWINPGPAFSETLRSLCDIAAGLNDYTLIRRRWPLVRAFHNVPVKAIHWGDSAFSGGGGDAFDSTLSGAISFARMAYWAGDEDAYKFACYHTAKQLLSLWTVSMAYPKWVREKNLWTTVSSRPDKLIAREEGGKVVLYHAGSGKEPVRIDLENLAFSDLLSGNVGVVPSALQGFHRPCEPELRFMKDRMSDYARYFLDTFPRKHAPEFHKAAYVDRGPVPEVRECPLKAHVEPVLRPRLDEWDRFFDVPLAQRRQNRLTYWQNNGGIKGHEFEIIMAGIEQKYLPIWQGGTWTPKPDAMFRQGFNSTTSSPAAPPAFLIVIPKTQWPMLAWQGPLTPQRPKLHALVSLPLCGIMPDDARGSASETQTRDFAMTIWAADCLKTSAPDANGNRPAGN